MKENEVDISKLEIVGCDGTPLNTGYKGGIIRHLELHLNRPLHRSVCLLHCNELPLRHLIKSMGTLTVSPNSFSGPIGSLLSKVETLPVKPFIPIPTNEFPVLSPEVIADLSSDQKYLYFISQLVRGVSGFDKVLEWTPGPINHARWLTTANRLLRLYVSTSPEEPFYDTLYQLAQFIIFVYSPIWFNVKSRPEIKYGSVHFADLIRRSRYLPKKHRDVVDNVLRTNFFFGHSENVLLAMLGNEAKKAQAIELIIKIRQLKASTPTSSGNVRFFRTPNLLFSNFNVDSSLENFEQILDLEKIDELFEPPLTMTVSNEDLLSFEVPKYPNHTQAVERCIQLVTSASSRVSGQVSRDGLIQTTIYSRKVTGKFNSKKDFNVALSPL